MSSDGQAARPSGDFFALDGRGFPALDGLRAVACVMIFNVHFFAQYAADNYFLRPDNPLLPLVRTLHSGSHGVDIFFVVSGYLAYRSLAGKRQGFGAFLLGRYKRLLPVVLLVNIPALFWVDANWRDVVDNIFFLSLFPGSRLVTFVTWALVYEMYFYILSGVWLIVFRAREGGAPWRSYLGLFGLYLANVLWLHQGQVLADWRFAGFFVGLGLAMLEAGPRGRTFLARMPSSAWPWCLAMLFVFCRLWSIDALGWLSARSPALALGYFLAFDLTVAALIASQARIAPGRNTALTWKGMRMVGAVSYSLFMLHTQWGLPLGVSLMGGRAQGPGGLVLAWAVSFALSFLLATFVFVHLERFYFRRAQ